MGSARGLGGEKCLEHLDGDVLEYLLCGVVAFGMEQEREERREICEPRWRLGSILYRAELRACERANEPAAAVTHSSQQGVSP